MAGNFRFMMDQKDIVRFLTTTIDSFIQDRLINKAQRTQHKEQCAERLAAEDGNDDKETEVEYSDQAVLANLDWGIEALEEDINTYNMETKLARLDYAEKMLQVCAMLNPKQKILSLVMGAFKSILLVSRVGSSVGELRNTEEVHQKSTRMRSQFKSRVAYLKKKSTLLMEVKELIQEDLRILRNMILNISYYIITII